jgi:hypothetical protein
MDADTGVTAIETSVAGVTTSTATGEVIPPCAAVMVVVLAATAVATPELLMVATAGSSELHVTVFVIFCVVWLLKVPVAV